jgi:hypothetical protein
MVALPVSGQDYRLLVFPEPLARFWASGDRRL